MAAFKYKTKEMVCGKRAQELYFLHFEIFSILNRNFTEVYRVDLHSINYKQEAETRLHGRKKAETGSLALFPLSIMDPGLKNKTRLN